MQAIETKRILIADDDPTIRTALQATLEAEGYEVSLARDGQVAIEALLREHFDLAILDLAMPRMDGLEVLRELQLVRSMEEMPPMIVLTAHGSVTAAVDSARYGAVDFLHKPILPDTLRAAVARAMERASARGPGGENFRG